MTDQIPSPAHRLDEFTCALRRVRGWKGAKAEQLGEGRIRVTNPATGLWIECRREGGAVAFLTIGRRDGKPAFEPEFARCTPECITMRAKQQIRAVRRWDRRMRVRRMHPRVLLIQYRWRRSQARREPLEG